MSARPYHSAWTLLGAAALWLGYLGVFLFLLAIPWTLLSNHLWEDFGFRESYQATPHLPATATQELWWAFWHRLCPLLVLSALMIAFGFYANLKETDRAINWSRENL